MTATDQEMGIYEGKTTPADSRGLRRNRPLKLGNRGCLVIMSSGMQEAKASGQNRHASGFTPFNRRTIVAPAIVR